MPSTGIDRNTGKILTGLAHVRQSVQVIFTTYIASRIMRRTFGSFVPVLLGRSNLTKPELLRFFTAIHLALGLWEPRLRSLRVVFAPAQNTRDDFRQGHTGMSVKVLYYPNALQGDFTSDVVTIDL